MVELSSLDENIIKYGILLFSIYILLYGFMYVNNKVRLALNDWEQKPLKKGSIVWKLKQHYDKKNNK